MFQRMATMRDYGKMTPLQAAGCVRERRRDLKESRRLTDTPGAIVATARKLFELRGVRATSIAAIAKEANVARELIYYHFANRNGLIEAVIDDYVEDLVESVIVWNEARVFGDTPGSLRKCIRTFRYSLYDGAERPRPMIGVLEELGVRDAYHRARHARDGGLPGEPHREGVRGLPSGRDRAGARDVLRRDIRPGGPCEDEPPDRRRRPHEGDKTDLASRHGAD